MLRNAVQGAILVVIALALFLDLRLALWVMMGVPFAVLATLATIYFLDLPVSINLWRTQMVWLGGMGLIVLAVAAAAFAARSSFDVFALSAVALGLNTLLVAGLGRLLFENSRGGDAIGSLFLLGAVAAGLLAASVNGVLRLSRYHASQGASS